MLWKIYEINKTLLQVLGLCISPNLRYLSNCFTEIYRAQYENAMLVYLCGTPTWQPENSVNIWNLLWLSRQLVISTEKTGMYISTFPNALTSKRVQIMRYLFFIKLDRSLLSRTSITRHFKMLWFANEARYWAVKLQADINILPIMPGRDKNFGGSLVLDFRMWWHHVKTICY